MRIIFRFKDRKDYKSLTFVNLRRSRRARWAQRYACEPPVPEGLREPQCCAKRVPQWSQVQIRRTFPKMFIISLKSSQKSICIFQVALFTDTNQYPENWLRIVINTGYWRHARVQIHMCLPLEPGKSNLITFSLVIFFINLKVGGEWDNNSFSRVTRRDERPSI